MGELCVKHNVAIISDEIHSDLLLWNHKHIPMATISPEVASITTTCFSIGKTFNLAGVQASSVHFGDPQLRKTFNEFWTALHTDRPNSFAQTMTIAAYNEGEEWLHQLIDYIQGNAEFVHNFITTKIPKIKTTIPQATYLMWLDCRDLGMDNDQLWEFLIHKAKIGLNLGNTFDENLVGYARMNIASPRSLLEKALNQLKDAVDALE